MKEFRSVNVELIFYEGDKIGAVTSTECPQEVVIHTSHPHPCPDTDF